jgi:hypothetical protein
MVVPLLSLIAESRTVSQCLHNGGRVEWNRVYGSARIVRLQRVEAQALSPEVARHRRLETSR